MVGTSARLLRLLGLFQGRRYWSGQDLAARLETTTRTVRRDVDKLRSLGYPIHSATGAEGGYQLGSGSMMPPLLLDDEEAVAVALGVRSAATGAIEGLEDASLRALAKIDQLLPPRLARRVAALQSMIVTSSGQTTPVDAQTLAILAAACRDCESLRFRYQDYSGKASSRNVEPHRLVHVSRRWYLVAWDADRTEWRTFRLDRIQSKPVTGVRVVPREPPARDLAEWVMRGRWQAPSCRARIRLRTSAESLAQRLPACAGMIEAIDENSCWFETSASTWEYLAMNLAWSGVEFEVSAPPELVEQVQLLAQRYGRASRVSSPDSEFRAVPGGSGHPQSAAES